MKKPVILLLGLFLLAGPAAHALSPVLHLQCALESTTYVNAGFPRTLTMTTDRALTRATLDGVSLRRSRESWAPPLADGRGHFYSVFFHDPYASVTVYESRSTSAEIVASYQCSVR